MLAHPSFETVQPTQTEGKIDITATKIKPIENYNGSRWLSWSQWSQCVNGERTRIRACLRMGLEPCFGSNVMVEKCLASANVPIAMAHDPWSIEKEISQRSK
uniref:Aldo_ket_red domain-containing protein n=1 Tax=Rhabditophanes sp. KR3021 TaxID=114890 RepID=A0AC35UHD2_9BILA